MRTFIVSHVFDTKSPAPAAPFSFDTQLFATYTAGLAGPGEPSATVDLVLFDQATGQPLIGSDGRACTNCTVQLDTTRRKEAISLENIVSPHASRPNQVCLGYGVVTVAAASADAANLFSFVTNAQGGAFELSVFGFAPAEVRTAEGAGAAAYAVTQGASHTACGRSSKRARSSGGQSG
jgi:hypothetical protein